MAQQQQRKGSSSGIEQELAQEKSTQTAVKGLNIPPLPPMSSQQRPPRRPSAEEMIEYYCRKGLDKQAATEKVVDDLQKALTIAVSRYPRNPQEAEKSVVRSVSSTLDSLSTRLSAVEAKVDEKPDLGGVFVAGVAAGGVLQAIPHVLKAISQMDGILKNAISSKP